MKIKTQKVKLKRCPFCGGKAVIIPLGAWDYSFWITCEKGCIRTQREYSRIGNAAKFWNRRQTDEKEDVFVLVDTDRGLEIKEEP